MLSLLLKDFFNVKKYLWQVPVYVIFGTFVTHKLPETTLAAVGTAATYILMLQACAHDDKNKSDLMLNSLPLPRHTIVLTKYLSVFIYALFAFLSYVIIWSLAQATGIGIGWFSLSVEIIAGAFTAMALMGAFYYPLYFRFGYIRSNIAAMFMFFAAFFLPGLAISYARVSATAAHPGVGRLFRQAYHWLQTQTEWQVAVYLIIIALILMIISYRLSIRFYSRREF